MNPTRPQVLADSHTSEWSTEGRRSTHEAPRVEVDNLSVDLMIGGALRPVLRNVSFQIAAGQTLGLVGESGSGKSVTARAISRLLPANSKVTGNIKIGDVSALDIRGRELRRYRSQDVATIFQDPRAHVNPVRTVGDYLTEGLRLTRGMGRRVAEERALAMLDDVGIAEGPRRLRQYPHEFSGGMLQRIVIAGALAAEPSILLADEPTTALDATVQAEIMALLNELKVQHDLAILLITHDLEMAAAVSENTAVMYGGGIVEIRPSAQFFEDARHPYSRGLLQARPRLEGGEGPLAAIPGQPVAPFEVETACAFYSRCAMHVEKCQDTPPPDVKVGDAGFARCHSLDQSVLQTPAPDGSGAARRGL